MLYVLNTYKFIVFKAKSSYSKLYFMFYTY